MNNKRPQKIKSNSEKKRHHDIGLQIIPQSQSNKTARHKNSHKKQWNKIEEPYIKVHIYSHLICDKEAKNRHEKRHALQQWC
jgi:hypothetical protein